MKLIIKLRFILITSFLLNSPCFYGGNNVDWESKATYDIVPDSLKKYDLINIFNTTNIEFKSYNSIDISYTIHLKTKIFSQKGLEDYPQFFIPDLKRLSKVKARTIKPDGSSIDLKKNDIKITPKRFGAGLCKFVVPGANIGDEIEILISYSLKNETEIDDYFFNKDYYTIKSELNIETSDYIKIETKSYNNLPNPKTVVLKNKKTYNWVLTNLEKIGKKSKIIIHNDLPYLRFVIRSFWNKYGQEINLEYSSWSEYRNSIRFNEYTGHRLSYDKKLGSFIDQHLGAETANLSPNEKFENLIKTISFINDSITIFYPQDTTEYNKLLGEHLKNKKLPAESVYDLYSVILDMCYFDYYLCLGRNKYLGDIDAQFVSRNQITDVFFSFLFDNKYYFIFPKKDYNGYDLGEIPNELEGSKAISFPRRGTASGTNILNLPKTSKVNNTKTINTFAYVNLNDNSIFERSKLITTGAWTSIYRNGYKNLKNDSIDSKEIYKFIFNSTEDLIDSLNAEKNEHSTPFVFSLKYNKIEKNYLTYLNDSLKMTSLTKIISHVLQDLFKEDNQDSTEPISFLFSDNIKYYLIFDKPVSIMDEGSEDLSFTNEFGSYEVQIKQLNPKTIFVFSRLSLNKSNLNTTNSDPLYELGNKIREAKNINLSFKIVE